MYLRFCFLFKRNYFFECFLIVDSKVKVWIFLFFYMFLYQVTYCFLSVSICYCNHTRINALIKDKPVTAYSIVFLNFTFSTSFSSAILTVEILFLSVGYSLYNIWIGSIAYVGCNLIWPVAYIGCNLIWPVT